MWSQKHPCLQAGPFIIAGRYSYRSEYGYAIVDKRPFIPELWFGDNYLTLAERIRKQEC